MSFAELESQRQAMKMGVNAYCRSIGLPKSSYYNRKKQAQKVELPPAPDPIEAEVKRQCEQHPVLGYRPIHQLVKDELKVAVSNSTIYRRMKGLGLLQEPPKAKRQPKPLPPADIDPSKVGLTIGLDFTHWQKKPLCNVLEYESRYCLASLETGQETAAAAIQAVQKALAESAQLGLPITNIVVKSDQGSTFTADEFRSFLAKNACYSSYSAVGVPQGMGRLERYNRSVKEQGLARYDFEPGESSQGALDEYREYYNQRRPHQALGYLTPADVIESIKLRLVHA